MRKKRFPVEKLYFLMNKAAGVVCSKVSDRRKTVYDDFPEEILIDKNGCNLHSVGRLDADTEGLLLFTNDGFLSNFLTRPENKIKKTYLVHLKNFVSDDERKKYLEKAESGLVLPAEKKSPEQKSAGAQIEWINEKECKITLTEGKFHEVKRIFRALGNEVEKLKRISFASLVLPNDLKSGKYRPLTENELNSILLLLTTANTAFPDKRSS